MEAVRRARQLRDWLVARFVANRSQPRVRVLVVGDDAAIRIFMSAILASADFDVTACGDGRQVVEFVRKLRPEVVIIDAVIRKVGGLRIAQELHDDPATTGIAVLIVSAAPRATTDQDPSYVGARLDKPFDAATLLTTVRNLIKPGRR